MNAVLSPAPTADLSQHPGYSRVFQPGKLTIGFIMPLESYPDSPFPTLSGHVRMAKLADEAGFAALWMRDVPFYDPTFGDAGQVLDPMVYLGYLASQTRQITLGTTALVLPLRDPIIVAKQAASVDVLSDQRLVLGLSTGDRPTEYPAFGADFDNRGERYQEAIGLIKSLTEESFPVRDTQYYGSFRGNLDLVPKPVGPRLPLLVVGRARQDMRWIAKNTDGWISYVGDFNRLQFVLQQWHKAGEGLGFKPYGYGSFFELVEAPDAPARHVGGRFITGRNALIDLLTRQQEVGVNHVALNLKAARRPAEEILQELAEFVLPQFADQ